jgi:putative tryptophan/tyrosine transport system substrate-binding protein
MVGFPVKGRSMRRRDFITLLGGGAAAWPLMARAQQAAMPVIGFLSSASPESLAQPISAIRLGLQEIGYVDGKNVVFEFRTARSDYDKFSAMADDLVRRKVALIIAPSPAPALAAKAATSTIPIVFHISGDPVQYGLVASLNRPGGNVTGVSRLDATLGSKRLELLHQVVPRASIIGVLINPSNPESRNEIEGVKAGARAIGQEVYFLEASEDHDFDLAFATLSERKADGLLVEADAFISNQHDRLVGLAARYAIPTIYDRREFAIAGGLISYGAERLDPYYKVGIYAGRILAGVKPADLPVEQATKFELIINLKTAKALGLTVPQALLVAADEVIE